jgi:hypothetical protein
LRSRVGGIVLDRQGEVYECLVLDLGVGQQQRVFARWTQIRKAIVKLD